MRVPRWATERKATSEGWAGTVSSSHSGRRAALIPSTTKRCSARSLGEAARRPWASASARAVSPRAIVPARGWHEIRLPCRAMSSSGDAPKKVPSGTGKEKMVQWGSCARNRRNTAERGSCPFSATVTLRESTTLSSSAPGAPMVATARATRSR